MDDSVAALFFATLLDVADIVGCVDGMIDKDGSDVGDKLGNTDGSADIASDGGALGMADADGFNDGDSLGITVGSTDGVSDDMKEGLRLGLLLD